MVLVVTVVIHVVVFKTIDDNQLLIIIPWIPPRISFVQERRVTRSSTNVAPPIYSIPVDPVLLIIYIYLLILIIYIYLLFFWLSMLVYPITTLFRPAS